MEIIKKTKSFKEVLTKSLSFEINPEEKMIEQTTSYGIMVKTVDSTKNFG